MTKAKIEEVHDMLVSLQTIPVDDELEDEPVLTSREDSPLELSHCIVKQVDYSLDRDR